MGQVYSTQFLVAPLGSGEVTFTAPDGSRTILRDLDGALSAGDSGSVEGVLVTSSGTEAVMFNVGPASGDSYFQWRGRQVLNPGDTLTLVGSATFSCVLSGYLLTL